MSPIYTDLSRSGFVALFGYALYKLRLIQLCRNNYLLPLLYVNALLDYEFCEIFYSLFQYFLHTFSLIVKKLLLSFILYTSKSSVSTQLCAISLL